MRRLVAGSLSLLLHLGIAAGLIVAWSAEDRTQPLFVDLTEPTPPPGGVPLSSTDTPAAGGGRTMDRRDRRAMAAPPVAAPVPVSPAPLSRCERSGTAELVTHPDSAAAAARSKSFFMA